MQLIEINNGTSLFLEKYGGDEIRFFSKPGIPNWDRVSPSQGLIVENSHLVPGSTALCLGCGHGAHILALAGKFTGTQFIASDNNGIALELLKKSIMENAIPNVTISLELSLYPQKQETFDTVIIDLPKGRKLSRRWLLEAYLGLKQAGILLLAGANDQGIQSVVKDAANLFKVNSIVALKKGNRLIRFTGKKNRADLPAWCDVPGILPGSWMCFDATVQDQTYHLKTLPGVFASDGLDPGTALLLSHLDFERQERILDFGCGCGIVGLVIARNSKTWVDMLDIDRYALAAANENSRYLELQNCEALYSDGLEAVVDREYDLLITNPPFHSGKGTDYTMTHSLISQSLDVLSRGGELRLVANKFIRYDRILKHFFSEVSTPISNQKYTVWSARRS